MTSLPGAGLERAGPPPRGIDVLLVEDHAGTARALSLLLGREGYNVRVAGSVAAGIRAADEGTFDLLLCDLQLPDGTCLDLMRLLQARLGRQVIGIAMSGHGSPADRERSLAAGFVEHLVKPLSFEQLEAAILRVCGPSA
jgi:two-component system CheB/CheR fusion protein